MHNIKRAKQDAQAFAKAMAATKDMNRLREMQEYIKNNMEEVAKWQN